MTADDEDRRAHEVVATKPKRKWQSYIWDSLDKSPEERRSLFKIDTCILSFAALGIGSSIWISRTSTMPSSPGCEFLPPTGSIVSVGDQLSYMQTCWTVGYVIGEIPSNIIPTRVRPSIWIPLLELIWYILTLCLSRCNTAEHVYAVRFLVGLAEGGFYPGMQYVIGSWYRSDELGKRSCIFHCSSAIATTFSGYLMAAVYHLEEVGGLRGWQWLFLVDGIISIPVALAGFFMVPDMPENTRVSWLSREEKAYARKRMELEGRKGREPYTKAKISKIFKSWHIYVLTLLYVTFNNGASSAAPVFAQFLKISKDPKYNVWQINVYPTTTDAVQIVTTLLYAWTSDSVFRGARWPAFIF